MGYSMKVLLGAALGFGAVVLFVAALSGLLSCGAVSPAEPVRRQPAPSEEAAAACAREIGQMPYPEEELSHGPQHRERLYGRVVAEQCDCLRRHAAGPGESPVAREWRLRWGRVCVSHGLWDGLPAPESR